MGSNKSWLAILLGTAYALFSPSAIFAQQTETDSTRLRLPDSFPIVQRIGLDLRPTYIAPMSSYEEQTISSMPYARLSPPTWNGLFSFILFLKQEVSIHTHIRESVSLTILLNLLRKSAVRQPSMFSRDQELPGWDATCLSTTNGTSELLLDGILMTSMTM